MADSGRLDAMSMLSSLFPCELSCIGAPEWGWKTHRLIYALSLLATCLFAYSFYRRGLKGSVHKGEPPFAPNRAPFLGHLLSFSRDPAAFCLSASNYFGEAIPCHLDLIFRNMYLISGSSNINLLWKNSDAFSPKASLVLAMQNILKLSSNGATFCELDDSGKGPRPHPRSNVEAENRIWFHTHDSAATYLSGSHLKYLTPRFLHLFRSRLKALSLPPGWSMQSDLFALLYNIMFPSQIEVLFGSSFLDLNPAFTTDFRNFNRGVVYLLLRCPRWMVPKTWEARERCLTAIKKWHAFAQERHANEVALDHEEETLRYGSRFMSARQEIHNKMKPLNANDIASLELTIIFAATANFINATCWYILELAKDPETLSLIRAEVTASASQPDNPTSALDTEKLCAQPLIQSGYAEVLRLHTYNFLVQTPEHEDFDFRGWKVAKDQMVAFSSHTAHMDSRVWNTRSGSEQHPLNTFWAERFLMYESDSRSGPLNPEYSASLKTKNPPVHNQGDDAHKPRDSAKPKTPKFSLAGLNGIWAPYGGGYSYCPGRHLAKEVILVAVANLVTAFDFRLVERNTWWTSLKGGIGFGAHEAAYRHDMKYFGLGVLPPGRKVEVMMRRRV